MQVRSEGEAGAVWRLSLWPESPQEDPVPRLDAKGLSALLEHLRAAERSSGCRVVVLRGRPGYFCGGMSLQDALAADQTEEVRGYAEVLKQLGEMRLSTICVVDGEAQGGAVGLAAAHDLVLAGPSARFSLPECVLGLIPAMVMPVLLRRLTVQKAKAWAILGDTWDAQAALSHGLADRAAEDVEATLTATLKRLLRTSPDAIGRVKALVAEVAPLSVEAGLAVGAAQTAQDLQSPEIRAALQGFLEGERPPWFARYRRSDG